MGYIWIFVLHIKNQKNTKITISDDWHYNHQYKNKTHE